MNLTSEELAAVSQVEPAILSLHDLQNVWVPFMLENPPEAFYSRWVKEVSGRLQVPVKVMSGQEVVYEIPGFRISFDTLTENQGNEISSLVMRFAHLKDTNPLRAEAILRDNLPLCIRFIDYTNPESVSVWRQILFDMGHDIPEPTNSVSDTDSPSAVQQSADEWD